MRYYDLLLITDPIKIQKEIGKIKKVKSFKAENVTQIWGIQCKILFLISQRKALKGGLFTIYDKLKNIPYRIDVKYPVRVFCQFCDLGHIRI